VLTPAEHLASPEPGPDPGIERRFYPRLAPSSLISVAFADGNVGMLLNLSENGFLASTPLALAENFVCRVSLLLSGLANPIEVYARVVWTAESHRAGIQFLDLSDHDRERIRKWAEVAERPDLHEQQSEAPPQVAAPQVAPLQPRPPQAAPPQTGPGVQVPVGSKTARPNLPNMKFSRIQLLAGVVAALAMLAMAMVLSSKQPGVSGTQPFSWKNVLAMQPGGAAWSAPLDKQAPAVNSPARTDLAPAPHSVAPAPATAPPAPSTANDSAAIPNTPTRHFSSTTDAPTHKSAPAKGKAATSAAKIASEPLRSTPNATKTRVRNPAILAAQNHFGNQYVGHLDLADSGANDSTAHEAAHGATVPKNATVAGNSAKEPANNAALPSGPAAGNAHTLPQASAIAGSILGKGAPNPASSNSAAEDEVPANLALLNSMNSASANSAAVNSTSALAESRTTNPAPGEPRSAVSASPPPSSAPAPASALNGGSAAPAIVPNSNSNVSVRSSSVSPANPTGTTPAASPNRFWQVTLPNSGRASFINLPGEQVLQSSAVTMHIQRSILAPASGASGATASATNTNASRTETVHLGELLSHVEPWTPRLTQETGARVTVRAYLGADGRVERLVPVNGSVALVSSAARAVREWRFAPTLLDGKPVQTAAYVVVEFHPQNEGAAQP
jgi:hypothetical protein